MTTAHRRALGTLLLVVVLLTACTPVTRPEAPPSTVAPAAPPTFTAQDIPTLVDQLDDPNWIVANQAAEALAALGDKGAQSMLEQFNQTFDTEDRQRASLILRVMAHMPEASAPRLGAVLADGSRPAVGKALAALGLSQMGQTGIDEIAKAIESGEPIAISAVPLLGQSALITLTTLAGSGPLSPAALRATLRALVAVSDPLFAEQKAFFDRQATNAQAVLISTVLSQMAAANPLLRHIAGSAYPDRVRQAAIKGLGETQSEPALTVPMLLDLTADARLTATLRSEAVTTLGAYGMAAVDAVPILQTLLAAQGDPLQAPAALALGRVAPGQPEVMAALAQQVSQCNDPAAAGLTVAAAQSLAGMGLLARSTQNQLLDALNTCTDEGVRAAIITTLGRVASPVPSVVDALSAQLNSSPPVTAAAVALGQLGPAAQPVLIKALVELPSVEAKASITSALTGAGVASAPALVDVLLQPSLDADTEKAAADALATIGPPALPFMIQALRRSDSAERQRIVDALYAFDSAAYTAFQVALADPTLELDPSSPKMEDIFGIFVVNPGGSLGTDRGLAVVDALPFLIESARSIALTLPEQLEAVHMIGWIGPEAAAATPMLAELLTNSDPDMQCEAAWALLQIGPRAAAAAPALARALEQSDAATICSQASLLQRLAETPPAKMPPDRRLQLLLIEVLAKLGPKAEIAVPQLVQALQTPALRRSAAEALAAVGASAHAPLLDLLRDQTAGFEAADVRRAAAYALHQSGSAWSPALAAEIAVLAQNPAENRYVRAMLASGLANAGQPIDGIWEDLGLKDPVTNVCLSWQGVEDAAIRVLGYDLYSDTCLYGDTPTAPLIRGFLAWWNRTFRR